MQAPSTPPPALPSPRKINITRNCSLTVCCVSCYLQVFSQASSAGLLEVSRDIAETAANWLVSTSQDARSGQFQEKGVVIHSEMVGGVNGMDSEVSLTAFVTGALIEAHTAGLLPADAEAGLAAAVGYLLDASRTTNYAKVLVAHTLAQAEGAMTAGMPAGLGEASEAAFSDMQDAAITEGSMKHWAPKTPAAPSPYAPTCMGCSMPHASALEVEMTGYALTTIVEKLGENALAEGLPVQAWLVGERSQHGGWVSTQVRKKPTVCGASERSLSAASRRTVIEAADVWADPCSRRCMQDTTVALEGLSRHAALASDNPPDLEVTVSYPETTADGRKLLQQVVTKQVLIDADNYDIVQRLEVPVGKDVTIGVSGSGKAVATIGTSWHTSSQPAEPSFLVNTKGWQTSSGHGHGVTVELEVSRLAGAEEGMVMANMQVFSGMTPKQDSLDALTNSKSVCNGAVKRVEYENDQVSVYIDRVSTGDDPCVLEMELDQESSVENLQPAIIEVFEYYNPKNAGTAELAASALADGPPDSDNDDGDDDGGEKTGDDGDGDDDDDDSGCRAFCHCRSSSSFDSFHFCHRSCLPVDPWAGRLSLGACQGCVRFLNRRDSNSDWTARAPRFLDLAVCRGPGGGRMLLHGPWPCGVVVVRASMFFMYIFIIFNSIFNKL